MIPRRQRIPMMFWDGDDLLFLTSPRKRIRFKKAKVAGGSMTGALETETGTTVFQIYINSEGHAEEDWSFERPESDGVLIPGPWGDAS